MQLLSVGLNHQTAPLPLRERIAVSGEEFGRALERLHGRVSEGFLLSTCNRTEYYALVGHAETGAAALQEVLLAGSDLSPEDVAQHLAIHSHEDAVRHLFRVAAGLESMVPGEDQILAQVKAALERASEAGMLGATTHRLGASALAAGKRVRSKTGIGRHSLSVVSVALQRGEEELGALARCRVVVVGAGGIAELALKHLAARDVGSVTVVNRHPERAAALASAYGARAMPWDSLHGTIADADLVLCCTSNPDCVITEEMVSDALARRNAAQLSSSSPPPSSSPQPSSSPRTRGSMLHGAPAPFVLLDLAVPRDVDPTVASLAGVRLINIDSLEAICAQNREHRLAELQSAEDITESEVARFMTWWSARELSPTITALVDRATAIRNTELERLMTRLPALGERDEQIIRTFAARLVQKLLHDPLTVLKRDPEGANMAQVVRALFSLDNEAIDGTESAEHVAQVEHAAECPRVSAEH